MEQENNMKELVTIWRLGREAKKISRLRFLCDEAEMNTMIWEFKRKCLERDLKEQCEVAIKGMRTK